MKNKLIQTISIISILIISVGTAKSESFFEKERIAIHPKIGFLYNIHSANFNSFQGTIDCGLFKSGKGIGTSGSIFFEKQFDDNTFLGLGIGFADRSGTLSVGSSFPSRDLTNNQVVTVKTDNKLNATISYFELQPDFRYILIDNLFKGPFRFAGGLRVFFPLSSRFEQSEVIASPSGAVFTNEGKRSKERELSSGAIETMNTVGYGISVGFDNLLQISNRTLFSQSLMFDWNFRDVTSDAKWKTYAVRLDLGYRFSLRQTEPKPIIEPPPPPPPPIEIIAEEPPPIPTYQMRIKNVNAELHTGNELLSTAPLVNAVFFSNNSAELHGNYNKTTIEGKDLFTSDALALHDYLFPRIADIIKRNPNATIVLEAATSGASNEPAGMQLARARAEAVKNKLVEFGINSSRITVTPRIAPRIASNQDFPEGIQENQRVDIILQNAPLQEYVDIQKYSEIVGKIELNINFENYPDGTIAEIHNSFDDNVVRASRAGDFAININERIENDTKTFSFHNKLKIGEDEYVEESVINVDELKRSVIDLNLSNFNAILRFDYNSSTLSEENKGLLRQLAEKLPEGATIQILGSADALGSEERNIQLSRERASNTELFIKSVSGNKFKFETGISTEKFSDDTPQGRFLNRSIRIKVK